MKIRRLVNCFIPVSLCNFECRYCYIPQCEGRKKNKMPEWRLSPEKIGLALSNARLGGACFMNLCGDGETLLPKEMPTIIGELLKQGHVLEIVTNGTMTDRFDEILQLPKEYFERLEFKFSYHYEQLKKKGLLDIFWNNVKKVRAAGCSITVELTPHDELIPLIEEIKKDCMNHVGALCHVTTTYDYSQNFKLNTKLSMDEYLRVWKQFESPMFDFKMSVYGQKRREYCYAGEYLMSVDLATGLAHQCYIGLHQNIYDDIDKAISWSAIGKHCSYPFCFNAHALMVFGAIPELATDIHYTDIRNRKCIDGSEWLSETVKEAFDSKFIDSNETYSSTKKVKNEIHRFVKRVKNKIGVR